MLHRRVQADELDAMVGNRRRYSAMDMPCDCDGP
ncbi:unnamed protein product, partial [Rotaria magnacalcarata]